MTPDQIKQRFPTLTKQFKAVDLAAFADRLRPASWPAGTALSRFGERSDTLHLITSGSVSIHVEQDGEDLLLGQAGAGCVVGELGLVEPGPSSATLTSLEDVTTLDMSHEDFELLCRDEPGAASALLRAISHELVHRLRSSSRDILRRIDDHHWMRVRAQEDKKGWLARIASLVRGEGAEALTLLERLTSTPQFSELSPDELEALAAAMDVIEAEDGEVLIKEGARGDGCYFIVDGSVRISHERDERSHHIQELEPGELFGLVALLDDGARSATCTATGPTTVAWLPSAAFTMLHEGNPKLVLHFQKLVVRQLAHDARGLNEALVRAMVAKEQGESPSGGSLSGELHLSSDD